MGSRSKKAALLLFLVFSSITAGQVAADFWGGTYDVVLSDTGASFYDTDIVGLWPNYYAFVMRGEVESYSTSWYEGEGHSSIAVIVLGVYFLDYSSVKLTNTQGFSLSRTYTQASFTGSFYYPFLDDYDGGPRSTMTMRWHYKLVGAGTF
ncbi:hypothetical protein [Thermococcus thioreducens]|uniref:Uncharacterized protein n=1 Tax=Thermococcus thioreducens TaxID=277988 RepID=A0A0Q2XP13_9EURY|nr:hypothetical protein [Thermococcus thioreducens]ASJ12285.1 hypothetical protein A3L14_04995 [Thermococcus thioreducens]KQH83020.1 hypothetical protein AMR53_01990 [Thermococcus thioreducens]SEV93525.1 hypothetical protein SAMN05216170_0968 [Thermococcus thioreducens]